MRNFKDLYEETVEEKKSPSEIMQQRRKMGRRMKILARKSSTKIKKKRNRLKRRDNDALKASAQRQAKMAVIKRSLGPSVNYKELPIAKRIQIDQNIVAKKRKVIDKISKKLLRQLKQKEGQRIKQNRASAKANVDAVRD
tara:strand:+ start:11 stop:430 length:420 start_codon:yes stop_codon:yes gene_type:complete